MTLGEGGSATAPGRARDAGTAKTATAAGQSRAVGRHGPSPQVRGHHCAPKVRRLHNRVSRDFARLAPGCAICWRRFRKAPRGSGEDTVATAVAM